MFVFQVRTLPRACVWFLLVANLFLCQGREYSGHFKLRAGTMKEFQFLKCRGVFDKQYYNVLSNICDDCQNLFRQSYRVTTDCKDNCFNNEAFSVCLSSLLLDPQENEYKKFIAYLSGQEL